MVYKKFYFFSILPVIGPERHKKAGLVKPGLFLPAFKEDYHIIF
jgi:hypothetical protein